MGGRVAEGSYGPEESRALAAALAEGEEPRCPRCGAALAVSEVRKPPQVSYVRSRRLLVCPTCRVSTAVDS